MKIDASYKSLQAPGGTGRDSKRAVSSPDSAGEVVSLSSPSLLAPETTEFDAGKVGAIKSQIAAGTFFVNSSAISENLLAMARDLISSNLGRG